jgi:hypothetical protein
MPPDQLTERAIAGFAPAAMPFKRGDGAGLYLLINPNGSRYWRFNYRFGGKRNTLALGVHPAVSLEQARARRDEYRALMAAGTDPGSHAKSLRAELARVQTSQAAATRFLLDNDGALSVRLPRRGFALTPEETAELRSFLDATQNLPCKVKQPCP